MRSQNNFINFTNEPEKRSGTTFGEIANGGVTYTSPLFFGSYTQNNFLSIPAVYAALDIISNSVASMPLQVRQRAENKDIVIDHPVLNLFDEMIQTKFTCFRQIIFDVLFWGNAYIYIKRNGKGEPIKLIYLEHGDVSVEYNKTKGTVLYNVVNHLNTPQKVKPENMLHFLKNTRDGVTGIGLLAYATQTLKLSDNMNNAASNYFGNGMNISGILKFKGAVPDKSKEQIRTQWQQIHSSGSVGAGLVIASADCDYEPVANDPSKSQLIESRKFGIEEVSRFFGISPVLLQDLEHGNSSAIEQLSIQFVKYTLMPLVTSIENELNRKLFPGVHDIWLDLQEESLLAADKQSMANYLATLTKNGIISTNEARVQLDLNPVDGGDSLLIPYTDLGMNTINPDSNTNNDLGGVDEQETKNRNKTTRKKKAQ